MRHAFDVLAALLGLIVLSPVFLVIAVVIALEDRGPVMYRAKRVGLNGRIFRLLKFRTMVRDADRMGAGITHAHDRRITRAGRMLRRYKLDEFPQLLNVITRDMNLVGPRPEDPRYIRYYSQAQEAILSVRPGLTSPASLLYKDESMMLDGADWEDRYIGQVMPAKLRIDLNYFKQNTFSSDLHLIVQTIKELFHTTRQNAILYSPNTRAESKKE